MLWPPHSRSSLFIYSVELLKGVIPFILSSGSVVAVKGGNIYCHAEPVDLLGHLHLGSAFDFIFSLKAIFCI